MEIYCNEPESDFGTDESDFVTCHDSVIDLSLKKQSARKRISGGNISRDGLRIEVKTWTKHGSYFVAHES